MWLAEQLTDVVLQDEGQETELHCHKSCLTAASSQFRDLLQSKHIKWLSAIPIKGLSTVRFREESIYLLSLSLSLSLSLPIYVSLCLSVCLSISLSICLFVYLSVCLSIYQGTEGEGRYSGCYKCENHANS